ncbi:MAG: bifunctional 5,10-methylene-tetrahydrofolate dehydrogenase/5,10-methylene-tetrahydrofolate cyclohydrolase, partial [Parasporobacterium sp.]|nr:bifunctional 5,10-methylene-tetrahydrofolate dehydrogenase/5,10-methylene-tetrahydrofolate cyclohydrolase [Parasporobacterium sp.]
MAQVIKGSDAAAGIKSELKKIIREYDLKPRLAVIQAGNDDSNAAYGRGIKKACDDAGIEVREYTFPGDISQADFEQQFIRINEDPEIHGILLYRPLPEHLDENRFAELIDPDKDMDCMSPVNWAKLAMGN